MNCFATANAVASVSNGNNLDSGSGCPFTAAGDLRDADPRLGPLQNNGGLSETHALGEGSPAIDAGAGCPSHDQRLFPRPAGPACDIGAFEVFGGSGQPQPPGDTDADGVPDTNDACPTVFAQTPNGCPVPAETPRAELGETLVVREVSGNVFVATPVAAARASAGGASTSQKGLTFVPLSQVREVPVGSFLDTRRGTVSLTSARDRAGRTQSGNFNRGLFQVLQSKRRSARGLTDIVLKGGSFARSRCGSAGRAQASALRRRVVRRVRSNARGRFRTRGRHSAATVRGTVWETTDRCDGTLTKVTRGSVTVFDNRRRKNIVVRAGKRTQGQGRRPRQLLRPPALAPQAAGAGRWTNDRWRERLTEPSLVRGSEPTGKDAGGGQGGLAQ